MSSSPSFPSAKGILQGIRSHKDKDGKKRSKTKQWFQSLTRKEHTVGDNLKVEITARERKQEKKKREEKQFVQLTEEELMRWPLHKAVWKGDANEVKKLLDKNSGSSKEDQIVRLNQRDRRGNTPLHIAIHLKKREIIHLLLLYGADITYKNGGGWSPLQEAVASGEMRTVTELYLLTQMALQQRFEKRISELMLGIERVEQSPLNISSC